jgi:hypothetical protein
LIYLLKNRISFITKEAFDFFLDAYLPAHRSFSEGGASWCLGFLVLINKRAGSFEPALFILTLPGIN